MVRWCAAGLLLIGLSFGAARHLHLFSDNRSTPLTVEEVKQRYENSTSSTTIGAGSSPPPAVSRLPAPGVYTYATKGGDSVDALSGAHHDYPATTNITVTPMACGVQQRWDVLDERWETWQRCDEGSGIREPGRTSYDRFFGQPQTDTYVCTGAPRPLAAVAGTTWTTKCISGSATNIYDGVVVGNELQNVGASTVDTLHVRINIIDDTPSDSQVIDTWYLTESDLVVAQTSTSATSNTSPIGTVHYAENYEMHLASLTPLS
jgi:hypothetical protein